MVRNKSHKGAKKNKHQRKNQKVEQALIQKAIDYHALGDLSKAEKTYREAIHCGASDVALFSNLGVICQETQRTYEAIAHYAKALEINPNHPNTYANLGALYKALGNFDQARTSTLKSLELNPDNPTAHMNLGAIYIDLGNLDQALASTLQSLELKSDNPVAINNIKSFIDKLYISPSNSNNIMRAYELLLNQTDASHKKLSNIFLQVFLPTIQKASSSDPIISDGNKALKALAADWRFRKSLTLMIPPNSEVERFFTRLRRELLTLTIQKCTIPPQLKPLTEALAAQCFLN